MKGNCYKVLTPYPILLGGINALPKCYLSHLLAKSEKINLILKFYTSARCTETHVALKTFTTRENHKEWQLTS